MQSLLVVGEQTEEDKSLVATQRQSYRLHLESGRYFDEASANPFYLMSSED